MIKLIINPDAEAVTHYFNKKIVTIGNKNGMEADLEIPEKTLHDIYVKIIKEDDRFLVINEANDPFTSLNGLPFGKKTLMSNDVIQTGNRVIRVELTENDQKKRERLPTIQNIGNPKSCSTQDDNILANEDLQSINIEMLVRQVEQLESQAPVELEDSSTEQIDIKDKKKHSSVSDTPPPFEEYIAASDVNTEKQPEQKKYYLREFDDESENWNHENEEDGEELQKRSFTPNWKMLTGFLFAIIVLSMVICSGVYFRASGKNSQEEKKIGAGIADIAMAMTHAQLNHIIPNKQNWADPDFIRNNLARVLSPNLHTQAQIDNHGQFNRHPYILRVYTSSDMSRFLVIAQPAPYLLQWLVHKKTIVIDSTTMEIRKILDLKALNRLLSNSTPLEGKNGIEVSQLVKAGVLMPISSLAGNLNHWAYSPPKALGLIHPGAANYIYNAPRYYPFGELLLTRAIQLNQNPGSSNDVATLQEEMEVISQFQDIVLYSSKGLQTAVEAQKALATFAPASKFLVGYIKFNAKGYVASSHLLMNEARSEIALLEPRGSDHSTILDRTPFLNSVKSKDFSLLFDSHDILRYEEVGRQFNEVLVDRNHPLYLQLKALAAERPRALKPIADEINALLNQQNHDILSDFNEKMYELLDEYKRTDHLQRRKMVQELTKLYQEYSEVPLEELMKFFEASELTSIVEETLKAQNRLIGDKGPTDDKIEWQLEKILDASTLDELDGTIQETAEMLTITMLPNPDRLIIFQDRMHHHVLQKLSHFLLSHTSIYSQGKFKKQDRTTLIRILRTSWVTDSDEFEYFLSEYDHLQKFSPVL